MTTVQKSCEKKRLARQVMLTLPRLIHQTLLFEHINKSLPRNTEIGMSVFLKDKVWEWLKSLGSLMFSLTTVLDSSQCTYDPRRKSGVKSGCEVWVQL